MAIVAAPDFGVMLRNRNLRLWRSAAVVAVIGAIALVCAHQVMIVDTDWARLGGFAAILKTTGRFIGIDWTLVPQLFVPVIETLMMATLGTVVGALLCVPVIWLGALNITPSRHIAYPLGRLLMTVSRSIHEIVWALIFVSAVGLGSLAGILALAMRSIGFIAKITAEAIENVDKGPIEAMQATGAGTLQVFRFAIMPQILPVVLGVLIFEWDINIRRSAIMGLVGAGGLGLTFHRQMVMFNWPGVTTVILAILGLIALGELLSHHARKAVT